MIYLIHGNILATVHQKANGNYVIEIKTRHIINKTLINSVKFCVTEPSLNKKMELGNPAFMRVSGLLSCVLSTDDSPKQRNLSHDYKGYKPGSYKNRIICL